jgi:predicted secreted protein
MSRFLPALVLVLGLAAALPVRAEAPAERDAGLTVLHLSETGEKTIRRDRLHAALRAEASGPEARKVQAQINKQMAAALELARKVSSVKVETGGYSVWQEQPQKGPARWRGSQSLTLVGSDPSALLGLVGELQHAGLVVSSLEYQLAPETARAAEDSLTDDALMRLRVRAERIAKSLGMSVVRLRELRVGNAEGGRPRPPVPMRAMASKEYAPPVAEPGEATVTVTVEAEVLLGPAKQK